MHLQLQLPVSDFGFDNPVGAGHAVVRVDSFQNRHIDLL
jgi:hypothetical protein